MLDLLAQRITGMFFWYFVVWNPWRVRDLQGTQTCENNYTIALGGGGCFEGEEEKHHIIFAEMVTVEGW